MADQGKIRGQFGDVTLATEEMKGAVSAMLSYLEHTQKSRVNFIDKLTIYSINEFMELDIATRRNLEITETMRDKAKKGSLLGILDKTKTSMGARKLKQWVEKPLVNSIEINKSSTKYCEKYYKIVNFS